jgi:hypothetical protein
VPIGKCAEVSGFGPFDGARPVALAHILRARLAPWRGPSLLDRPDLDGRGIEDVLLDRAKVRRAYDRLTVLLGEALR